MNINASKAKRSYAIIGAGALGGFYGAKLQLSGLDVHYLLQSDYEYVKEHGLIVDSVDENFILPQVNCYNQIEEIPFCDVVLVALKTTQNHLLRKILPSLVRDDVTVLLLQNGLGVEAEIAQIIPKASIVGGVSFLCSNKLGPGHIRHLDYGQIILGQYALNNLAAGITATMQKIGQDFIEAGISIEFEEDLFLARWKKLVWNIPFNGLSVVLDAPTDQLMTHLPTRELVKSLMFEVQRAAGGYGRSISLEFIENMLIHTKQMNPYLTSMKLDYDKRRAMEIESMFGNPLRAAQKIGVATPKIEMLYQQLKFLDARTSNP